MSAIRVVTGRLDAAPAEALLAKHHVGSIAVAFHDHVTISLLNYVYAKRWIYARLEDGPDLAAVQHHPWVAIEVSEISGIYDWRTVTARGSVELLRQDGGPAARRECDAAIDILRTVVPAVFTKRDPMPQRVQVVRIHVDELVGRQSRSESAGSAPP
jgi:nitroimidazol reductase NimA-like FMN-containing flavoprotein (pyridoxamine 5'-phosphate oxidase superfamily)